MNARLITLFFLATVCQIRAERIRVIQLWGAD
jgi:hypothetical protein